MVYHIHLSQGFGPTTSICEKCSISRTRRYPIFLVFDLEHVVTAGKGRRRRLRNLTPQLCAAATIAKGKNAKERKGIYDMTGHCVELERGAEKEGGKRA